KLALHIELNRLSLTNWREVASCGNSTTKRPAFAVLRVCTLAMAPDALIAYPRSPRINPAGHLLSRLLAKIRQIRGRKINEDPLLVPGHTIDGVDARAFQVRGNSNDRQAIGLVLE